MNVVQVIYLILGGVMFVALLIFTFIIAGKDIILAFKRRFDPRGADVLVVNLNRNVSQYYLKPKDGLFRIKGKPYVANPQKVINLTNQEEKLIMSATAKREKRISDKIGEYQANKLRIDEAIQTCKNDSQLQQLHAVSAHFSKLIQELENSKEIREENYFRRRRAFYLFLEDDPLPKNLHEYQSIMDSQVLDNVIVRIKTAPQEAGLLNDIKTLKLIMLGVLIMAAVAAYFGYRDQQGINVLLKAANLKMPGLTGGG